MKSLLITSLSLALASTSLASGLFAVGQSNATGQNFFGQLDTSTGQLMSGTVFSLSGLPGGTQFVGGLTYVPTTNRFLTVAQINPTTSALIEINAMTQTTSVVALPGLPVGYNLYEGVEYSAALNKVVLSVGNAAFVTGKFAFLNSSSYAVDSLNLSTGLPDGDTLFTDSSGALNLLDTNNPMAGNQRNLVNNPLAGTTFSGVGSNFWSISNPVQDMAYKSDDGNLYTTTQSQLFTVNPTSTGLLAVGGPYAGYMGATVTMRGLAVAPVPEPATMAALGIGALALMRRRRKG